MNPQTANKLGPDGVKEYWSLQRRLMTLLDVHKLIDGHDFYTRCDVAENDGQYLITCDGTPIDGISSIRRDVIQALFDGASTQLGR